MSSRRSQSPEPRSSRRHDSHDDQRRHRDDKYDRDDKRDSRRKRTIADLSEVGVKEISMDDYFLKAHEFRRWLREEKRKYMDELSGKDARRYFQKFVDRWNECTLPVEFYSAQSSASLAASSQTGYKWAFASNRSRVDKDKLDAARQEVDRLTNGRASTTPSSSGRVVGPTLPPPSSHTDRQLAMEAAREDHARDRKMDRNRAYERADALVPKSGGREGRIEEKRAQNAINREARDKDMTAGLEVDEQTLMGGGGGFSDALAAQKAAAARRQNRRSQAQEDQRSAANERLTAMKSKEAATMEMFKQMAQARFGGS